MIQRLLFVLLLTLHPFAPFAFAQTSVHLGAGAPGARPYAQTFTSNGSFVVPGGVNTIYLTGCGAGGGGGGGHTADPGGGGGGGGGAQCVSRMPVNVTAGSTLTVTIGTAGVGGAAGAAGGTVSLTTSVAGLPIGTYSMRGPTIAAGTGTATNGGAGGGHPWVGGGGATGTGAGANSSVVGPRNAGGDYMQYMGGGAGGGATGPGAGGTALNLSGYATDGVVGGSASGTKGGGGGGGPTAFSAGGVGGTNAAGTSCSIGYGGGGGGGAPTFAGGNGCPGFLKIEWWN